MEFSKRDLRFFSLVVLLVASCKSEPAQEKATPKKSDATPAVFDAIVANTYLLDRKVEAPGTILPAENTNLSPEISGRVVTINFKEGAFVKAGTILVKLFDGDLQAQLKKLAVQLQVAETTEKRQKELLAINGTSQQDYDLATLNVSNIKADMELLRVNIARTEIRAPFDGRLGLRNISLGAYITPQTIISNIAQVNNIKVEFAVPEQYAAEMQAGKTVSFRSTYGGKTFTAQVIAAQNSIELSSRNLMVRARVLNPDKTIAPGSFVQVSIQVGENGAAIMIPTQAVLPSTRNKTVIVSENGVAAIRTVVTGFRDSARVEIINGISKGDTILINGLLTIKPGMPVKTRVAPR